MSDQSQAPAPPAPLALDPRVSRLYSVTHTTSYRYGGPVQASAHVFRLRPVHDRFQEVVEHELSVSVPGRSCELEDVFGNQVVQYEVTEPYTELVIEARSVVRVYGGDEVGGGSLRRRRCGSRSSGCRGSPR